MAKDVGDLIGTAIGRVARETVQTVAANNKKRGGVVINEQELVVEEAAGFTTEDILWAVGIWSVILCLSPVILFYMLMIA